MKKRLVIGTRSSDLALWQAYHVKAELEKFNKNLEVEIRHISTKGDKILDVALSKIGDKGLFTKELENSLLNDEVDIAVHSLKDMQTKFPDGLKLAAVTKRADYEDVLIARNKDVSILDLPEGATVATGSLRRRSQLKHLRPDINIEELRGNVPTRIKKFLESDWDAIILARAGVERLKLTEHISSIIPEYMLLPAVGQGALGIQIKETNTEAKKYLQPLHHNLTWKAVSAERAFLRKLEGGCQVPIAALGIVKIDGIYLDGFVGSVDGSIAINGEMFGSSKYPEKLGEKLGEKLIAAGAGEVLKEIYDEQPNAKAN